ncbi:PH and SEC7 domain-containing protein isoform X2 [Drosophila eugracilis]|uniref:PH and SEC7 domain-containing protein isoform X2 n=1 Tax=Drosophila eugracilis TaxID=29029 RepID=UPI001BDA91FC|nr:PH and SEC7 domain-containing protein isoform X2 [Drosophila eugracilis]XP_017082647.2 PH and SEC7 domain-containing protein isoform X2 [Drosophila eugracilis]
MSEELKVVLRRSEQHSGFGFSLLGTTGPPHVIYDIVENSPAADCGAVEAGDVILKVNGTDVHRYTTKQVLKCLRLSEQLVTLELKRDPKLKARIKEQLANTQSPHYVDIESPNIYDYNSSSTNSSPNHRPNTGGKGVATTPSQSGLRYKSPTHLPSLRQNSSPLLASGSTTTTTTATHTHTHSRNSSASSTKIKVVETSITTSTTGIVGLASPTGSAGGEATSPTFRPSRIPQALTKCAVPKPVPVLHSPQNKRPRPSQIPTKASNGNGNGHTPQLPPQSLQHSNSYSGSPVTRQRFTDREQEREPEPNSAPPQPAKAPRFEAYMMTGDLILNLSRTPQTSNPLPAQTKKVDSLRDSPSRPINSRINGALAPRASGESSPTSSSSVDSPINTSSDSVKREAKLLQKQQQQQQQQPHQQQQQRDSINNSYNRKDSLTNDTLLMCEELEQDEEGEYVLEEDNKQQRQRQQQHRYRQQQNQQRYEYYQNEDELEEQEEVEEEREEDQTHYDITNIETYQSGLGRGDEDDSDRQCLVDDDDDDDAYDDEENDAGDEDYSTNSLGSGSAKQRLRALKQRTATRQQQRNRDAVDCAGRSGSGSSSTTVKSEAGGLGLDETSFSVPTSPISLSTPLIDKETANSVPTSPEPSSLVPESSSGAGAGAVVVRRHNGHVVRKCDAAGFRTSKSEDHLQQIQREGIAAVIPIDIDEDVNSSLNTLLDTRQDSEDSQASDRDRIVWTYNAPLQPHQLAALQRQQQQQEQQFQQQQQQLQQQHMQQQQQLQQQHQQQQQQQQQLYGQQSHSNSHSSSISSSPQHSAAGSPASPTSVSSSVMSSSGSKGALGLGSSSNGPIAAVHQQQQQQREQGGQVAYLPSGIPGLLSCPGGGPGNNGGGGGIGGGGGNNDQSVSEAISNISSPDYQDDDNLLSSRDILGGMVLSDPSDSDSTILVSDAAAQQRQQLKQQLRAQQQQQRDRERERDRDRDREREQSEHKVVIQVRGLDSNSSGNGNNTRSEEDGFTLTEGPLGSMTIGMLDASPPVSDDGSDVESLHSYHYSPKAVDMPSAIRLAKRLYSLDGFKKSDVSRHLSKNNDFSRAVADEYLKHFTFEKKSLDQALREFLQQFSLSGETQERERVLVHFSKRFLDCNPGTFNSQDAVHTLTCAIMLLNTDLHGQNMNRKMSCAEFVDNLADLNDGENFPKDVLKSLYQAIKTKPLEWALDEEAGDLQQQRANNTALGNVGQNPFLDPPELATAVEYKKGYVMRKCCYDSSFKKTPFGKRSWKMFYCTLRDLVLYLHKDEHGFRKSQMSDNLHNAIRIHHALATKANDYTKKQHVFRLQTADQAEYLFQTSDSKELQSWVETINYVCAAISAPPLEGGVGSQKRFQRPLLPSKQSKLLLKEQLDSHEVQLAQLDQELNEHKKGPIPSKGLALQNYKEKESYLQYELRRYRTYVSILSAKMLADQQQLELQAQQPTPAAHEEEADTFPVGNPACTTPTPQSINQKDQQKEPHQQPTNRKEKKKK